MHESALQAAATGCGGSGADLSRTRRRRSMCRLGRRTRYGVRRALARSLAVKVTVVGQGCAASGKGLGKGAGKPSGKGGAGGFRDWTPRCALGRGGGR